MTGGRSVALPFAFLYLSHFVCDLIVHWSVGRTPLHHPSPRPSLYFSLLPRVHTSSIYMYSTVYVFSRVYMLVYSTAE